MKFWKAAEKWYWFYYGFFGSVLVTWRGHGKTGACPDERSGTRGSVRVRLDPERSRRVLLLLSAVEGLCKKKRRREKNNLQVVV